MCTECNKVYGQNVVANGRNWNAIKILTALGHTVNGHRLTNVNIQIKEQSVLVILKKASPKGAKIAFLEANSLDDALWVAALAIKSKTVHWRDDMWMSTRNDK